MVVGYQIKKSQKNVVSRTQEGIKAGFLVKIGHSEASKSCLKAGQGHFSSISCSVSPNINNQKLFKCPRYKLC